MDIKIVEQKPITLAEVKDALDKHDEDDQNFRISKTKEYLNYFVKVSKKQALDLKKKIEALEIPRIKDEMIVKVVDLLPDNEEYLSLIFQAYPVTISSKNLKRIVEVVKEFKKKIE